MTKDIRFFKLNGRWYADIPNHTLEENEMVMGSEVLLEKFANGSNEVTVKVSDIPVPDYLIRMYRTEHDSDGAWYQLTVMSYESEQIWICNVTHDVFGEHPEEIYIIDIK